MDDIFTDSPRTPGASKTAEDNRVIVIGNCIAGMVAALELARAGREVLVVNPSPVWGGHFSSKVIGGQHFDLGMVGFEFTGFHNHPTDDVSQYDPRQRNNVARFCGLAKRYAESLIDLHRARVPMMLWEGSIYPDVLMGNDLSVLKEMPPETANRIREEVEVIISGGDRSLHASGKVDNPLYLESSFEQASLANHGRTFHELFIAPFADRLFPGGASSFAAIYHRCLWMPLYYPETLLAATGPNPHDISTMFHYPAAGRIGALGEALLEAMQASGRVSFSSATVEHAECGKKVFLKMSDGTVLQGQGLVWGLDLPSLYRVTGKGSDAHRNLKHKKTSAAFGFFTVDRSRLQPAFSSLFIIDRKRLIYRITNLSDSGGTSETVARLVLELDSHHFEDGSNDPGRLVAKASEELVEFGLIPDTSAIVDREAYAIPAIMPVPNSDDHERFWEAHDVATCLFPDVRFVGPSSGYLITTMNDQIIQGLKVARELAA